MRGIVFLVVILLASDLFAQGGSSGSQATASYGSGPVRNLLNRIRARRHQASQVSQYGSYGVSDVVPAVASFGSSGSQVQSPSFGSSGSQVVQQSCSCNCSQQQQLPRVTATMIKQAGETAIQHFYSPIPADLQPPVDPPKKQPQKCFGPDCRLVSTRSPLADFLLPEFD